MTYRLLDSGMGQKLEQFGPYILARPCAQAVWEKQKPDVWNQAHAFFTREDGNRWIKRHPLPEEWTADIAGIKLKVSTTDFGHLGAFPEHSRFWIWMQDVIANATTQLGRKPKILNLFAYSGGATLAAARAGAEVCHLDASKGMTAWARENAALNNLQGAPIRWITDDVTKFIQREQRRESFYDAIILDPPTFGRGSKGELFQIEQEIIPLLKNCVKLLSTTPLFILFSCHTPGFTPIALKNLLQDATHSLGGHIDAGEMVLEGESIHQIPSGSFCRWQRSK